MFLKIDPLAGSGLDCVVCLPADKELGIARDIRRLFGDHAVSDCRSGRPETALACPETASASCHTQSAGNWTAKTCSPFGVDDCKTANRIEYCYCRGHRCNAAAATPVEDPPINGAASNCYPFFMLSLLLAIIKID